VYIGCGTGLEYFIYCALLKRFFIRGVRQVRIIFVFVFVMYCIEAIKEWQISEGLVITSGRT
jgi:hypothetical protein